MKTLFVTAVLAAAVVLSTAPAGAEPSRSDVIERIVEEVIRPGHASFSAAASQQTASIEALCAAPSADGLALARGDFKTLVVAWSGIEPYRFGPARKDNLFEKIFYWPDRKGRGLRQVRRVITNADSSASAAESLAGKSVALQGLGALEYVLFDATSDTLLEPGSYRCTYGQAIAATLVTKADRLTAAWADPDGFSATLQETGPDTDYRSHKEVLQDFLRIVREQLGFVGDLKLGSALGSEQAKAKPKRAPFWRSGMTVASLEANLATVRALLDNRINLLIPEEHARFAQSVGFELGQAERVLTQLAETDADWISLVETPETYGQLTYLRLPINGAAQVIANSYAPALGLTLGFNSLDGD